MVVVNGVNAGNVKVVAPDPGAETVRVIVALAQVADLGE